MTAAAGGGGSLSVAAGAGKTYTLGNTALSAIGMIPRAVAEIFSKAKDDPFHVYTVSMSYIQIYMELIQDLLSPGSDNLVRGASGGREGGGLQGDGGGRGAGDRRGQRGERGWRKWGMPDGRWVPVAAGPSILPSSCWLGDASLMCAMSCMLVLPAAWPVSRGRAAHSGGRQQRRVCGGRAGGAGDQPGAVPALPRGRGAQQVSHYGYVLGVGGVCGGGRGDVGARRGPEEGKGHAGGRRDAHMGGAGRTWMGMLEGQPTGNVQSEGPGKGCGQSDGVESFGQTWAGLRLPEPSTLGTSLGTARSVQAVSGWCWLVHHSRGSRATVSFVRVSCARRAFAFTHLNAHSSRSHAVVMVTVVKSRKYLTNTEKVEMRKAERDGQPLQKVRLAIYVYMRAWRGPTLTSGVLRGKGARRLRRHVPAARGAAAALSQATGPAARHLVFLLQPRNALWQHYQRGRLMI